MKTFADVEPGPEQPSSPSAPMPAPTTRRKPLTTAPASTDKPEPQSSPPAVDEPARAMSGPDICSALYATELRPWKVSLGSYGPTTPDTKRFGPDDPRGRPIMARSEAEACQIYFDLHGILKCDHRPTATVMEETDSRA